MMNQKMNQYVVFTTTFNEASSYHKLRLSLTSSTIYSKKLRDRIYLRDHYRNIWPVKVEVVDGDICFLDGWSVFAKHNYLEDSDVVVFYNGGDAVFDVKILGRDLSDKNGIGRQIITGEPTVSINEFKHDTRYESYLRRTKANEHHYASSSREKMVDPFCGDLLRPKTPKICLEPYLGRGQKDQYHASSHAFTKRGKYVDPFGVKFFKSHPDQKTKNPCFVTWLRKDRPHTLLVPMKVVKEYKLDLPEKLKLKDSEGRKWDAKLGTWKDGRQRYGGGGWRRLCRMNFVKHEDILICEFLRSEKRGLHTIHVHIFHP